MTDAKRRVRRALSRVPGALPVARLTVVTTRICLRYRVTGLASEAGFFALLSLPPLVLGLFGGLGYLRDALGPDTVEDVRRAILDYSTQFLTSDVINTVLGPTVDDVFRGGRADLLSIGFVLSLWSGSRALNVFVDTISIMYGQSGVRGIVQTRALSFSLYVVALVMGIITIPLVLLGPDIIRGWLPEPWHPVVLLYWPLVTLLTVGGLASLYHVSTPRRSPWTRDVPGAVLTLVIWALASFVVRGTIGASVGGTSIYGPLSAPIVILIWLYALAIAVLIGAALNAAIRELWPAEERRSLHTRFLAWVRDRRRPAPPVQQDPFAGYRLADDDSDELDLRSLRDAAKRPLTPLADAPNRADDAPSTAGVGAAESDR
ncbi:MAG: YihY/virulence factor BrkB family protein [Micrococcales bacterium]|uniref:YihY/virulence factor BrkB family protein n=1 Tax=Phycicoccus sp. TaxID=1902410 RepID=UPI00198BC876|nr:YihY/virulence factor BrkB family protein [Phycicoccus sp.]MBD3783520.1 YihY/virulence factor BrkB family protein [Micrococcales bacterium]HMM95196.1 YihY/virulence factor BrkB family protein [Phycicoccus sp.]